MGNYRDLEVWKLGRKLVANVYKLTSTFPKTEVYGITSQIQRADVSVPSNIAEGSARGGDVEFSRFLRISLGSLAEVDTLLTLSFDLCYSDENSLRSLENDLKKLGVKLRKLIESVTRTVPKSKET